VSPATPVYWIDSNVLISAKDGPFRFSVHQAFWEVLDDQAKTGRVRVSKMVYDEIVKDGPHDQLANWMKARRSNGFCITPDQSTQRALTSIADYVQVTYGIHQAAKFLSGADPWVIAHALAGDGTVVTFETLQLGAKKVKIPNVCAAMGVCFRNLYDMLEELGVAFG
jgi:hypothetical protein